MPRHMHLEHELLEHLSQLDYESIDETILLPTENWPVSDDDVLDFEHEEEVGVMLRHEAAPSRFKPRIDWRQQPEYQAFLGRNPELRTRARSGIDAIYAYFTLTPREADAWSLDAAGYTLEAIAARLALKPGGVFALLASVRSKITATMKRQERISEKAG